MNPNIFELGRLINPVEYQEYIHVADLLDVIVHSYGTAMKIPEYPCMMEYRNEGAMIGTISFSRHTYFHPVLKQMVDKVIDILTPIFPQKCPPNPLRVHILKTSGNIPIHMDESGRTTAINIGLHNSAGAVTNIGLTGCIRETFNENNEPIILQDGHGYIVNTSQWHSVSAINSNPRYLITYSSGSPFYSFLQGMRL